jgi:hypothetical protein
VRRDRFVDYLRDVLATSGHPDIVGVEQYDVPEGGVSDLKVRFADGVTIYLRVVRSAPPGGDDHTKPETIVTKDAVPVSAR